MGSLASNDFPGLLLLYSATGNYEGVEKLAKMARDKGKTNIAFVSYLLTGNIEECANILIATNRLPEAAFFARTYIPSRVDEIVSRWKADLSKVSASAAESLADPTNNKELFPDFDIAVEVEKMFLDQRKESESIGLPSSSYLTAKDDLELNLIELIKSRRQSSDPVIPTDPVPTVVEPDLDECSDSESVKAVEEQKIAAEEEKRLVEEEQKLAIEEATKRELEEEDTAKNESEDEDTAKNVLNEGAAKEDTEFDEEW